MPINLHIHTHRESHGRKPCVKTAAKMKKRIRSEKTVGMKQKITLKAAVEEGSPPTRSLLELASISVIIYEVSVCSF